MCYQSAAFADGASAHANSLVCSVWVQPGLGLCEWLSPCAFLTRHSPQLICACREFWTHFTYPGTFRGLVRATVQWACGNGWTFTWPVQHATAAKAAVDPAGPAPIAAATESKFQAAAESAPLERVDKWWVPLARCNPAIGRSHLYSHRILSIRSWLC